MSVGVSGVVVIDHGNFLDYDLGSDHPVGVYVVQEFEGDASCRQFEDSVQLLFVRQLALRLSNQLDAAGDASFRWYTCHDADAPGFGGEGQRREFACQNHVLASGALESPAQATQLATQLSLPQEDIECICYDVAFKCNRRVRTYLQKSGGAMKMQCAMSFRSSQQ
ncbi:hypothetical protein AK812_SmicGene46454 [Symbiodinium microadriaticum]|uniref:Uncharacterized protein n=1 Tax=Symbiodinium microadriaticum TaxID=2951 RepID=A0A1Q9BTW1_SYMMI|nr:hypothetical protein AK812_SmicGene46454 [Symbiodinium microadriaticum]